MSDLGLYGDYARTVSPIPQPSCGPCWLGYMTIAPSIRLSLYSSHRWKRNQKYDNRGMFRFESRSASRDLISYSESCCVYENVATKTIEHISDSVSLWPRCLSYIISICRHCDDQFPVTFNPSLHLSQNTL